METTETRNGHHWSQTLLGMALIVMIAYYGESVLAVLFFAILLTFMLSPVVQALEYLHIPRALAALISAAKALGMCKYSSACTTGESINVSRMAKKSTAKTDSP